MEVLCASYQKVVADVSPCSCTSISTLQSAHVQTLAVLEGTEVQIDRQQRSRLPLTSRCAAQLFAD